MNTPESKLLPNVELVLENCQRKIEAYQAAYGLKYVGGQEASSLLRDIKSAIAYIRTLPSESTVPEGWISVKDRLPPTGCYLCVIQQPCAKPYVTLACYGSYEFYSEDDGETYDEDEGRVTGHGWHNEEDSHGGEYDIYVVTYREGSSRGYVSHWMPRPELPAAPPPPGPHEGEK
jgi:hypothetical protein